MFLHSLGIVLVQCHNFQGLGRPHLCCGQSPGHIYNSSAGRCDRRVCDRSVAAAVVPALWKYLLRLLLLKLKFKKMPGYDAKTVEPLKAALVCPECRLLLRDAVQTGDGIRLCETCFKQFQE